MERFNPLYLLIFVPKNLISYLVGQGVRLKFPYIMQCYINKAFIWLFNISMDEASQTLDSYVSIEEVFTRALKQNSRKISGTYVSSADGTLQVSIGVAAADEAVQAKGLNYKISELILGKKSQVNPTVIEASWYTTVYLAPHNYHRVHAPFSGKLLKVRHIPGELWPVNSPAVRLIPKLFVRNERLVFDFELEGGASAWVVMVGALNVGRMTTRFCPQFATNSFNRQCLYSPEPQEISLVPAQVKAGEELGVFMLGSTTVVVLDEQARAMLKPRAIQSRQPIKVGDNLSG